MKTIKLLSIKVLTLALTFLMLFTFIGCNETKETVKMNLSLNATHYQLGDKVTVTVEVTGTTNTKYELTTDNPEYVQVNSDKELEIIKNPDSDILVKVVATSDADKTVSCNDSFVIKHKTVVEDKEYVKISAKSDKNTIKGSEKATLTVEVSNATNKDYEIKFEPAGILEANKNVITIAKSPTVDTVVKLTVTSKEDPKAQATLSITVKAKVVVGVVEDLTSDMIEAISGENITVSGELIDYYTDNNQPRNNRENKYTMEVRMAKDAWSGSWNIKGDTENTIIDSYRKGTLDNVMDYNGNVGHVLEKLYLNKHNEVAVDYVKNYVSIPSVWEAQHLWNHLGNLQINKFVLDTETGFYMYKIDSSNLDDLYLMRYLSQSLTPMLEDSLVELYLEVKDGKISRLLGQTEFVYYGEDSEKPDALGYTTIEVTFSNIGTTEVIEPKPYEASENTELLQVALDNMAKLNNYTFHAKDVTTSAPSSDAGEYQVDSAQTNPVKSAKRFVKNYTSSVGTVGTYGLVTSDAALFENTGEYTFTMDGKSFHTEYTGLKQVSDTHYDEFEYDYKKDALVGTKQVKGNIFDALPKFDLSANIFEFVEERTKNGKTIYKFKLRESSISRDFALAVSSYSYADDATPAIDSSCTITIDSDGYVVETKYSYELVSSYFGYVTTTYKDFNTTTIEEGTFDNYEVRVIKKSWAEYTMKYYQATYNESSHDEDAVVAINHVFGENAKDLPTPEVIIGVFGDLMYGPFFNWKLKGTDSDGNDIHTPYFSVNLQSTEFDENSQVTNYDELIASLTEALEKLGYVVNKANTDTSGGVTGRSDRVICYVKGDIQIVVTNNHTKHFSMYFYRAGDYTLNR